MLYLNLTLMLCILKPKLSAMLYLKSKHNAMLYLKSKLNAMLYLNLFLILCYILKSKLNAIELERELERN